MRLKPAAFRPVFSRVTLSRRLGRTQGIGAFTETLDGLVGPPKSVTTRSLIDRQCVESKRGKHRPNHCVFPAIGTGLVKKMGQFALVPLAQGRNPFQRSSPGARALAYSIAIAAG